MNIGENIKNLRELKNYSQSAMAKMLDVSQKTYSNLEKAGNNITIETIERISKMLNVSFNKIIELNSEAILNNNNQTGGLSQLNTAQTNNYINDKNIELYEKLISEKEITILAQTETILQLKQMVNMLNAKS